jgi:hypothetical protein
MKARGVSTELVAQPASNLLRRNREANVGARLERGVTRLQRAGRCLVGRAGCQEPRGPT